jgi:hypothetical protein
MMHFAYADPPYPGHTKRGLYKADARNAEVDHSELVSRLVSEFPDGWALSTGSVNLREVLPLCPPDARVMAWVKPFAIFKPNVNPGYCWEPVIVRGGRKRGRDLPTVRDYVSANVTIKKGCAGAKPEAFGEWLISVWNAQPGDMLSDLYPGSGAISATWERQIGTGQQPTPAEEK